MPSNPDIVDNFDEQGWHIKSLGSKKLTSLKMQTYQIMDFTVAWTKHSGDYRLIAFCGTKISPVRILMKMNTHLKRSEFSAKQVLELHILRWQTELLFNLDSAVKPRKIAPSTDAPDYGKNVLITNKVTTNFFLTPITPFASTLSTSSTAESGLKNGNLLTICRR